MECFTQRAMWTLYMKRKEGGRGLISVEGYIREE